jgi:CRISPR-associated protein Csb1
MSELHQHLADAVRTATAIGIRAELIAAAAKPKDPWQLVFPSTYEGGAHAFSPPDDQGVSAHVLIDSAPSVANRLEALLDDPDVGLPRLEVDVAGRVLSVNTLPHRVYDAILRDSEVAGVPFRDSRIGQALLAARPGNAAALFRQAPLTLLFGGWDSHAQNVTQSARWASAMAVEILGFEAMPATDTGSRIDPLGIERDAGPLYKTANDSWSLNEKDARCRVKDWRGNP